MMASADRQDFSSRSDSEPDYDVSIQTILSDDSIWTSQQSTLDPKLTERLTDADLDAFSLSELLLTCAQAKVVGYNSGGLFQKTAVFSHGMGLGFDVDICQMPSGQLAAVKHVRILTPTHREDKSPVSDLSQRVRKVLQEIRILKHPPIESCESIINLLGVSLDFVKGAYSTPSMLLEYAALGTLRHFLSLEPYKSIGEKYQLLVQVGKAVLTLHACRICHGDIKLDNVLVVRNHDGYLVAKLADFGSSIILRPEDTKATYWGTEAYNAPELQSKSSGGSGNIVQVDYIFACDVFAFGLLLFEALQNGKRYWKHKEDTDHTTYSLRTLIELVRLKSLNLGDTAEKHHSHGSHGSKTPIAPCEDAAECIKHAMALCLKEEPKARGDTKSVLLALTGEDQNALVHINP